MLNMPCGLVQRQRRWRSCVTKFACLTRERLVYCRLLLFSMAGWFFYRVAETLAMHQPLISSCPTLSHFTPMSTDQSPVHVPVWFPPSRQFYFKVSLLGASWPGRQGVFELKNGTGRWRGADLWCAYHLWMRNAKSRYWGEAKDVRKLVDGKKRAWSTDWQIFLDPGSRVCAGRIRSE